MAVKNVYIPFAILFLNMIFSNGQFRMSDFTAILVAYLLVKYDKYVNKVNIITPSVVQYIESLLP